MLKRSAQFAWAAFLVSLVGVGFAPGSQRFAGVLLSTFIFAAVLTWIPRCRPRLKPLLCPWNWALFVFALQLIAMPLLITLGGPVSAVLPSLPSATAINLAMVLNCLVFLTVCGVYNHLSKVMSEPTARLDIMQTGWTAGRSPSPRWIAMAAGLGVLGLILSFGNFGTILDYFNDPSFYRDYLLDASSTWSGLAALLLKPFLGFAIIAAWCRWMDFHSERSSRWRRVLITILAVMGTIVSFASFGYNRGAFAVPLVAIAGIVLAKADRFSKAIMVTVGLLILALMPAYAVYRSGTSVGEDLLAQNDLPQTLMDNIDISDTVQMYGAAPQYLGFLLERSHWGRDASWGATTISSILSPVPVLGKYFRQQSGFAVYNRMIYGTDAIADQNPSFAGETFLDFHIVGVVIGYAIFGWVIFRLQRAFDRARSSIELYIWQYLAIWICFVIFGGIEVPSQILIYACGPIYLFWISGVRARRQLWLAQPAPART